MPGFMHALFRRGCLAALAALFFATSLPAQHVQTAGDYVVYSWTANDRLAQRVFAAAARFGRLPGLPADAPTFGRPIRIYLAPDSRTFRTLTGGRAPEWGAGIAAPDDGIIVLRAYGGTGGAYPQLDRVLRHELAHVALHRYIPAVIPRWFDEGYAEWSAGELDVDGAWLLRVAFATQRAPELDSLELSWPRMSSDARVAYLLAASVVQYLVRESGTRGLQLFLERWHQGGNFEDALAATYGLSLDQLEIHWRRDVKRRYGWLAVLTQTSVAFAFMALAVIALFLVRRRRDRLRLAALQASELPDDPAFWTEIEPPIDPDADAGDIQNHGEKNQ